ncbi:MAG TPA: helix-turn-helix domain-containing protein [Microlunatus sp.]
MVSADTSSSGGTRGYVSRLRSQQAADTRDRVVRAAAELFAERGYAGTTLPQIGRRAGVSTETVQHHGPKVELLRAAIAAVSFGADPGAAVSETELGRQMMDASTAAEAARRSAEVLATVNQSSHGVWMAFSDASRGDASLTAELRRLTQEIAGQTEIALEQWRSQGWLRTDLPVAELARRAGAIGSVELWDRLVRLEELSPDAYRELIAGMLLDLLTPRSSPDEFPAREESHRS